MAESGVIKTPTVRVSYEVNHNTEAGMPNAQKAAVLAREQQIRRNRDESMHIFNDAGQEVFTQQGAGNHVRVARSQVEAIHRTMNNMVVTHNHPTTKYPTGIKSIGNSFSKPDIVTSVNGNVKEMRAVTPKYTYSFKRPANGWGMSGDQAARLYTTAKKRIMDQGRKYLDQQGWEKQYKDRAEAIIAHQINKEFVKLAKQRYGVDIIYRHKRG